MVERFLVKYHHWLDIGTNNEYKISLTPKHDKMTHARSLLTSMNLKDETLVETALQQEYGIIRTLPISKY